MRIFEVYIDKGGECVKEVIPAMDDDQAEMFALKLNDGAGEVVAVRDGTAKHLFDIAELKDALNVAKYDERKKSLLMWVLFITGLVPDCVEA